MSAWLSNAFLAPAYFGFLALIPIVVLLYLLKLRRTELVISSTMLWFRSLQDLTANAPFQRLRRNLLLFLQILVLLLVVFALARPYVKAMGMQGRNICIIIDHSASMQVVENGETRLEQAKAVVREMADNMARGDKMMIVAFADKASVLSELTDDTYRLRRAIDSIEAVDTSTRIRDAVLIVSSLSPDNPDVPAAVSGLEVVLLSDGNIGDVEELGRGMANLTYRKVGTAVENAGIVTFNTRKPEGAGEHQTLALVHNAGTAALETTVSLYFNDVLMSAFELSIPPGEDREAVFAHPDLGEGVLRAELDVEDALETDNAAWLVLQPATRIKVLLVSDPNSASTYFLRRVFALEPRVDLSAVSAESYTNSDQYDLVVFDTFVPAELPGGSMVFFNAIPPIPGLEASEPIANPPILAKDGEHPAMRFINPLNVAIREAPVLSLPPGARSLLSTTRGSLIADVSRSQRQIIVVSFDIGLSDWPLHLSFPLFVQNLVSWPQRSLMEGQGALAAGVPIGILPDREASTATVTRPGGSQSTVTLDPMRPVYFGDTQRAGVYTVAKGGDVERYAVNLLNKWETAVTPQDAITLGRSQIASVEGAIEQNKELWRYLIAGALGVLTLEWWIYSRRAWA